MENDGDMNGQILGIIMVKYIDYNGERILMVLLGLEWDSNGSIMGIFHGIWCNICNIMGLWDYNEHSY